MKSYLFFIPDLHLEQSDFKTFQSKGLNVATGHGNMAIIGLCNLFLKIDLELQYANNNIHFADSSTDTKISRKTFFLRAAILHPL